MRKRKVSLVLLAIACVYVVASGGISPLLESREGFLQQVLEPLVQMRPFDAGLLMVSVLCLVWALLLGTTGQGVTHGVLLRAVTIGSALLTTMFLGLVLAEDPASGQHGMTGTLALMALMQSFVGVTAGVLLLCRSECRKLAPVPLAMNGLLAAGAVCLVCMPFIGKGG